MNVEHIFQLNNKLLFKQICYLYYTTQRPNKIEDKNQLTTKPQNMKTN